MVNFRLNKGELTVEAPKRGEWEVTPEQAKAVGELLLKWYCFKTKQPYILILNTDAEEK